MSSPVTLEKDVSGLEKAIVIVAKHNCKLIKFVYIKESSV
jgi:hypothetical protein